MGWEPAEVTTYEYEGDRLVRAVTVREPEFSSADLAMLRVWVHEPARGSHGYLLSDAMSPDVDPANWGARYELRVPPPSRDFYQAALTQAQESYAKQYPDADMSSLKWRIERVER